MSGIVFVLVTGCFLSAVLYVLHNTIIINLNNDLLMHYPRKACVGPVKKVTGGQVTAVTYFDRTYIGFPWTDLFRCKY